MLRMYNQKFVLYFQKQKKKLHPYHMQAVFAGLYLILAQVSNQTSCRHLWPCSWLQGLTLCINNVIDHFIILMYLPPLQEQQHSVDPSTMHLILLHRYFFQEMSCFITHDVCISA